MYKSSNFKKDLKVALAKDAVVQIKRIWKNNNIIKIKM
jgi:hypothetical protein